MSETQEETEGDEPKGNQPDVIESDASRIRVNAGAGTGKTSTMVWKINHHIATDDAIPGRILALTFATKAAHNIESRVADELNSIEGYNVSAYTYHSFCHQLLKDYAYYTDHPPDFELVTDQTFSNLLPKIIDESEFEFINPMSPGGNGRRDSVLTDLQSFIDNVKHARYTPTDIRVALPVKDDIHRAQAAVQEILHVADSFRDFDTLFEHSTWSEKDSQMVRWLNDLDETLEEFSTEFTGESPFLEEISSYLQQMRAVVHNVIDIYESDQRLKCKISLPFSLFTDSWSSKYFESFEQNLFIRLREYVNVYRRAYDFVEGYEVYEQLLDERNALDYDDLIHKAIELLEDDVIGEELESEWDYIYCDEFQDTHQAELDLVKALAENSNLLIIGDTDQAIYEWRGADPENLEDVTEIFEDIESFDLDLNFRSYQGILDFTANLGHTDPLEAYRGRNENEVIRVNGYPDREAQAEQVATTVSRLIRGKFTDIGAYEKHEIAIIVRTNSQAREVANQLEDESIPFSISTTGNEDQPPGIETVLAYFRFLVDISDEISLSRVLHHLYGVPQTDLKTLHTHEEPLWTAIKKIDGNLLVKPTMVHRAVSDIEELQKIRKTNSVSGFYEQFREITKIEWYLTTDERRELAQLENKIEGYDDEGVQSMLTADFVSHLDLQSTIAEQTDDTRIQTVDKVEDKVNLLTIHRAKGLDFEVVLLPFLSDDEWLTSPGSYAKNVFPYDELMENRLSNGGTDWLTADRSDLSEQWRTLHVAITRAKDHLFFFGHERDATAGADQFSAAEINTFLSPDIEWSVGGAQMNLWRTLDASYEELKSDHPESVTDVTEVVNEGLDETRENITYYGTQLNPGEAEDRVLEFAQQLHEGELDAVDPSNFDLQADPGSADLNVSLAREHSHSSVETFKQCPRRHYLDHVVYAYDDDVEDPDISGSEEYIDYAKVGTLFHDVAEEAYWRKYDNKSEWLEAMDRIESRLDISDVEHVRAISTIETYFQTDLPEWEQLAAEWPFVLDDYLEGLSGNVKGYVDGVFRQESGDIVVIDYKTTKEKKSIDESYQLLLYLEALNEYLDDEEVASAGYVYVGEAGPEIDLFPAEDLLEYTDDLYSDLLAADSSKYNNYTNGDICADCFHHSLGCAAPEHDRGSR